MELLQKRMSEFLPEERSTAISAERKRQFNRGQENDLVRIGNRLAIHLHDEKIGRIVFLDRGARAAYVCLLEAWKRLYPAEPHPVVSFIHPLGLNTLESLSDQVRVGAKVLSRGEALQSKKGGAGASYRDETSVLEEMKVVYQDLLTDTDSPLMIFDTCQHSGLSTEPVFCTFQKLGFTHLTLGLASDVNDLAGIPADFVALSGEANGKCYPFGTDSLVQKDTFSVLARRTSSTENQRKGTLLRLAIKDIFKEKWGTLRSEKIRIKRD